jgi:hypothetical protein
MRSSRRPPRRPWAFIPGAHLEVESKQFSYLFPVERLSRRDGNAKTRRDHIDRETNLFRHHNVKVPHRIEPNAPGGDVTDAEWCVNGQLFRLLIPPESCAEINGVLTNAGNEPPRSGHLVDGRIGQKQSEKQHEFDRCHCHCCDGHHHVEH